MKSDNPNCLKRKSKAGSQKGIALIASLLALFILTLIGLTMTFVTTTETLINHNNKTRLLQLYASESAAEEARQRIKEFAGSLSGPSQVVYIVANASINPTTGSAATNPYFDPEYSPTADIVTIQTSNLNQVKLAWVKIRQKTETQTRYYDVQGLDGDNTNNNAPVFFGYHKSQASAKATQYVNYGSYQTNYYEKGAYPVYLLTALASDSSGYKQLVRTEISGTPFPPLRATLFSRDAVTITGAGVYIHENDELGMQPNLSNSLESQGNIVGILSNSPPPPTLPNSPFSYHIDSLMKTLRPPISVKIENLGVFAAADGSYTADGLSLGKLLAAGDQSLVVFVNGPFNLSNSTGQGILVVNGNLSLSGSFRYEGLIIAKGKVLLNGGTPGVDIHGAIIASSADGTLTSELMGNVDIRYNLDFIQKQFNRLEYTRLNYRPLS